MLAVIVSSSVHCDMAFMTTCRHPVFTAAPGAGRADHAGGVRGFRREAGRFNGETNHVHLLVDFPPLVWLSPAWTAASRGCLPAGCGRSSRTRPDTTGGRTG